MAKPTETFQPLPLTGRIELAVTTPKRLFRQALPEGDRVLIGRDSTCAIVIDDASVSRAHATVVRGKAGLMIEDGGSHNGTYVGGRRLHEGERAPLVAGIPVQIGACTLLARGPSESPSFDLSVIAEDPRTIHALEMIARVAPSELPVLILGETGTGKEVFAQALHELSPRATRELVAINCAAIPDTMVEAELFGYERGAFTGAATAKPGLFERAHRGTLFLDEIGELPLAAQAKLLRAIETGEVQRLGALQPVRTEVRVVAATHRDLAEWAATGRFRSDLLFRLNGVTITLPPLRERLGDLMALARHFLARAAARSSSIAPMIDPSAQAKLLAHPYPGNVRELRMVMERSLALAQGRPMLVADDVLLDPVRPSASTATSTAGAGGQSPEHAALLAALAEAHGNQTEAAKLLGVSRRTVVNRMEKYGVGRPRKGDG